MMKMCDRCSWTRNFKDARIFQEDDKNGKRRY